MNLTQEYAGPYRWDEAKERCPNDFRSKEDVRVDYGPKMTKEEEEEYYQKLADIELDSITY